MAKAQISLFHDKATEQPSAEGLLLVSQPGRKLTPAQREFNRLVAQVEDLRRKLERETRKLDEALAYYGKHIHPRVERIAALRKELVRAFASVLDNDRFKGKRDRKTLKEIIALHLDTIMGEGGAIDDEDLRTLFNRVNGVDLDALEQQELNGVRSAMESMFADLGIEMDLSDMRVNMSPEEMAAKAAQMAEQFRHKAEAAEAAFREPKRRKTKKQLLREERMRQAEEIRNKSIASIYKQLAKVLHPDLEQDAIIRDRKVVLMQQLTTAYHSGDLHTLLRLELEWIQREEGNLERLTDEKLAIYNQVLRDQVFELKQEIADLPYHPRYQPLLVEDGPFTLRPHQVGAADAQALDWDIHNLEEAVARMKTGDAVAEVRAAVKEFRAAGAAYRDPEFF
jgi:hypothetical protein